MRCTGTGWGPRRRTDTTPSIRRQGRHCPRSRSLPAAWACWCPRNVLITSIPHPPSDVPRQRRRRPCCWLWQAPAVVRASEHRQAAAAKLTPNALAELGVRRLELLERIGEAELVPLVAAHLV